MGACGSKLGCAPKGSSGTTTHGPRTRRYRRVAPSAPRSPTRQLFTEPAQAPAAPEHPAAPLAAAVHVATSALVLSESNEPEAVPSLPEEAHSATFAEGARSVLPLSSSTAGTLVGRALSVRSNVTLAGEQPALTEEGPAPILPPAPPPPAPNRAEANEMLLRAIEGLIELYAATDSEAPASSPHAPQPAPARRGAYLTLPLSSDYGPVLRSDGTFSSEGGGERAPLADGTEITPLTGGTSSSSLPSFSSSSPTATATSQIIDTDFPPSAASASPR